MFKILMTAATVAALSTGAVFGAGHAPQAVLHTTTVDGEKIYTDAKGMSLYTFAKDTAGVSNCNDDCAVKWPPLAALDTSQAAGDFSVITRADGSKQWAVKGMALYTWIKDKKPGDVTGDGVKGVWHLAKP